MSEFRSSRVESARAMTRGFILVELLVASALMSIAGAGLYTGMSQALKIDRTVKTASALHDPFKILWLRANKDLRNVISLRDYKFIGKQDETIFATLSESNQISRIHYFVKDKNLLRSEEKLPERFVKEMIHRNVYLKDVEKIKFEYAYLDEDERLVFKPIWMEEPYFGIPKAVRMEIKLKDSAKVFSRLISIPQGKWGHINDK